MKRISAICLSLMFWMATAVLARAQGNAAPHLGTADRIALQSCEKAKADAQKQWQDAQQQELAVLREWQEAHPGFRIDAQTFAITADAPRSRQQEKKPLVRPALPLAK